MMRKALSFLSSASFLKAHMVDAECVIIMWHRLVEHLVALERISLI